MREKGSSPCPRAASDYAPAAYVMPISRASTRLLSPLLRLTVLSSLVSLVVGCASGGSLDQGSSGGTGPGTGGGTGAGGGGTVASCDNAPAIFQTKCGTSICHQGSNGTAPTGGVELVTPPGGMTLGQSLLNQAATYPLGEAFTTNWEACPTTAPELIIDGANAANSLLLHKLGLGTGTFACGDPMPSLPPALTQEEKDCIVAWVNYVVSTGGGS